LGEEKVAAWSIPQLKRRQRDAERQTAAARYRETSGGVMKGEAAAR
jgi:hypothetical protein